MYSSLGRWCYRHPWRVLAAWLLLIVPSTMELLGARNWWLPRWLDRLIPNLRVEGELADRR